MKYQKMKRLTIIFISVFCIILISAIVGAEGLDFRAAIENGLENNSEIISAEEEIAELQRGLKKISVQEDWQLELGADYSYSNFDDELELVDESGVDLSLSKTFSSGFTLSPEFSIIGDDLESGFSISASQPLLPSLPTDLQQKYFEQEKNLLKAKNNLKNQKTSKLISWISDYLNLCRISDKKKVYLQTIEKAKDNLVLVKKEMAIGESGDNELITAQLSLQEAEYSLKDIEKQIEEAQLSLTNDLGLENGSRIKIDDSLALFDQFKERATKLTLEYLQQDNLLDIAKDNNYDIYANLNEKEILQQELEWLQKEDQPELDLVGGYDSDDDQYTIGLSASYSLYDSGQHQLKLQDKKAEIKSNNRYYQDLSRSLAEDLKGYLNDIELAEMDLEKGKLTIEKDRNDLEIAEKQLDLGLIDYLEFQEYYITAVESEVELASLADQLFIDKLEFISFLSIDDILREF